MDAVYRANPSLDVIGILFQESSTIYEYALRFNYFSIPGPTAVDFDQSKRFYHW